MCACISVVRTHLEERFVSTRHTTTISAMHCTVNNHRFMIYKLHKKLAKVYLKVGHSVRPRFLHTPTFDDGLICFSLQFLHTGTTACTDYSSKHLRLIKNQHKFNSRDPKTSLKIKQPIRTVQYDLECWKSGGWSGGKKFLSLFITLFIFPSA